MSGTRNCGMGRVDNVVTNAVVVFRVRIGRGALHIISFWLIEKVVQWFLRKQLSYFPNKEKVVFDQSSTGHIITCLQPRPSLYRESDKENYLYCSIGIVAWHYHLDLEVEELKTYFKTPRLFYGNRAIWSTNVNQPMSGRERH